MCCYGSCDDGSLHWMVYTIVSHRVTHDVGAVGCLKNFKNAIGVARAVMEHTDGMWLLCIVYYNYNVATVVWK